ncbi:hypothetical protein [Desulfogranum japonicum]|nr:hypothetical protein [Desulfogranum japonicum]
MSRLSIQLAIVCLIKHLDIARIAPYIIRVISGIITITIYNLLDKNHLEK